MRLFKYRTINLVVECLFDIDHCAVMITETDMNNTQRMYSEELQRFIPPKVTQHIACICHYHSVNLYYCRTGGQYGEIIHLRLTVSSRLKGYRMDALHDFCIAVVNQSQGSVLTVDIKSSFLSTYDE